MKPKTHLVCRLCGARLDAWLIAARAPMTTALIAHLKFHHPDTLRQALDRLQDNDEMDRVFMPWFRVVGPWGLRRTRARGSPPPVPAEPDPTFARRILRAMRAVARECGHPSAYPATTAGRLAALRQQLRMMDEERWFFSDVQRTLVRRQIAEVKAHTEG